MTRKFFEVTHLFSRAKSSIYSEKPGKIWFSRLILCLSGVLKKGGFMCREVREWFLSGSNSTARCLGTDPSGYLRVRSRYSDPRKKVFKRKFQFSSFFDSKMAKIAKIVISLTGSSRSKKHAPWAIFACFLSHSKLIFCVDSRKNFTFGSLGSFWFFRVVKNQKKRWKYH